MNNEIKDFFNQISDNWDNSKDNFTIIKELFDEIDIKDNDKVLDLGCGKGVITPLLYEKSKTKVIAIDISEKMIEGAKGKYPDDSKYEFICDDFYIHQFDHNFDLIVVYNAYPHFLDIRSFVNKCNEILNDDGKLVIMHSLSRERLTNHHQNITKISRNILEPLEESKPYLHNFKLDKWIDSDDRYLMVLKKF